MFALSSDAADTTMLTPAAGAGYDQIDVPVCTVHNIRVSNVPTAVDDATADTGVFLTLGALRGFNLPLTNLRKGLFRGKTPPPLGHDPQGKVLGILGMGGIGRNMAKKLRAFGMSVQYHNRNKLSEEMEDGAKYVGFEELLKTSDVISLNLPLNVRFFPRPPCLPEQVYAAFRMSLSTDPPTFLSLRLSPRPQPTS
jgi:lactate dehydrogenase-like 2-hydroxyacid dehydrogenase